MLELLRALAARRPQALAVASAEASVTRAQLLDRAEHLAGALRPGTVVASLLPGGPDFTAAHLATLGSGAVFLPLPVSSTVRELREATALLEPDVILVTRAQADALLEAVDVTRVHFVEPGQASWNDVPHARGCRWEDLDRPLERHPTKASWIATAEGAMVQLTSGSTGTPKGIVLSDEAVTAGVAASRPFAERFDGEAVFSSMPQFHAMGGAVVLEHLLSGASVLVANRFVPGDDLRRLREVTCAALIGSPSYFRMLVKLKAWSQPALSRVRAAVLGAGPSDAGLLHALREAAPGLGLHLRYGLSEAFGALTRLDVAPEHPLPPAGLVGPALPGVELSTNDSGAVRARTSASARGALTGLEGEPGLRPLHDDDGFLPTGDIGYLDEDGLHLAGREGEMIKRQGYRVDPTEIERVLLDAGAMEAVVVGVFDALEDSLIVAMVEGDVDPRALYSLCGEALSAFKRPQRIVRVDNIPRTHAGKPDRPAVRATLEEMKRSWMTLSRIR